MQRYFITSTGTGIGKTLITTSLCWQLRQNGQTVKALKPVISGYDASDLTNDTAQILLSCEVEPTKQAQERISPWRYSAPLSPNMAAAREGKSVELDALVDFCNTPSQADITLVDGVGGIMVPLNDSQTVLDWMLALKWPVIVTAGTYLGAINHTLITIEILKMKGLSIQGLILSESEASGVSPDETAETLKKFLPAEIPVVKIPRLITTDSIWKQAPSISWLCHSPKKNPKS
jgi:dethiobiotin synthetase